MINKVIKNSVEYIEKVDWNQGDGVKFSNSNINCGNIFELNGDWTFSTIVSFRDVPSGYSNFIIHKGLITQTGFQMYIDKNQFKYRTMNAGVYATSGYSNTNFFSFNTIYHITFTKSGNYVYSYLNGVIKQNQQELHSTYITSTTPIYLGSGGSITNYSFLTIYDIKIYNRVLTDVEILRMYLTMNQMRSDNGLMLDYRFDQKSGTVLKDYSTNGYNGTLTNFGNTSDLGGGAWVNKYGNTITQY